MVQSADVVKTEQPVAQSVNVVNAAQPVDDNDHVETASARSVEIINGLHVSDFTEWKALNNPPIALS